MKVVQCWDDGNVDDIRLVGMLREFGAKASFNLNLAMHGSVRSTAWRYQGRKDVWKLALGELRDIYDGFLVANHTATHPHLTRIPLEDAIREIRDGRDALEQHFGYPVRGFAYPFGDHNAAVRSAVQDAGHVYGRIVETTAHAFPAPDPMALRPSCHFLSDQFWPIYDQVRAEDGIFYFWGHSYELMTEADWNRLQGMIRRISADPAVVWEDLPNLFP